MGYKVILTAQADRDLEKIVQFLASKTHLQRGVWVMPYSIVHLLWRSCRSAVWSLLVAPNIVVSCIDRGS